MSDRDYKAVSKGFAERFAAEWRIRYVKVVIFASVFFLLPGALIVITLFLAATNIFGIHDWELFYLASWTELTVFSIFVSLIAVFFILPSGIMMITAPRVLAPVAAGLIERLDLLFILFVPIRDEDFVRNRFMEYMAGAPVSDTRINESISARIWWLSGQMKPELLLGGIPKHLGSRYPYLPRSLTNIGLPVGRLGSIIVRQWYMYLCQFMSWSSCCCSSFGCGLFLVPLLVYRVLINLHSLAFAAAYMKLLTDKYPWEVGKRKRR
ncbi:hypothetical protein J7K50_03915 [bacterium]|nr:hypothetical protein [bacterium]